MAGFVVVVAVAVLFMMRVYKVLMNSTLFCNFTQEKRNADGIRVSTLFCNFTQEKRNADGIRFVVPEIPIPCVLSSDG